MSSVPHQRTCPQRNPPHQRSDSVSPDVGTAKFPENYQSALYQKRRGSVPFHGKWISDLPFQFPKYLISVDFMCRFFIYTKKKFMIKSSNMKQPSLYTRMTRPARIRKVKTTSPFKENGALKHKLSVRNFLVWYSLNFQKQNRQYGPRLS